MPENQYECCVIGYSGLVGNYIAEAMKPDLKVNSKNPQILEGVSASRIYISAVSAVKWYANKNEVDDKANIDLLLSDLRKIKYADSVTVISTIDVYPIPYNVDENDEIDPSLCEPYGRNRFYFENEVRKIKQFKNVKIVRLPGLFGFGLKKNIIFDLLTGNPYGDTIPLNNEFQFYDLSWLERDLQVVERSPCNLFNFSIEPVSVATIKKTLVNRQDGDISDRPLKYDFKTVNGKYFGVNGAYLRNSEEVLANMKKFASEFGVHL